MRLFAFFLALFILSAFTPPAGDDMYGTLNSTSVMTYDIHMEGCGHLHPSWTERRSMVAQVIRLKSPELLGLQGTTLNQLAFLNENLQHYSFYYPPSLTNLGADLCPIMFDKRIYSSVDQGTYVLDEITPDTETASEGSDAAPFLNWVKLEHIPSKRIIYVINTSFGSMSVDHEKQASAIAGMQAFIDELVSGSSFVLLGNMAAKPESKMIVELSTWAKDSNSSSLVSISEIEDTLMGWEKCNSGQRVDYVFLSNDIPANSHEVVDIAFQNKFPSDHLPVFCRIRLN